MNTSSIMTGAENRQLLSLAYAKSAIATPAATDGVGLAVEAKQLAQARAGMRDGETFSVSA